MERRHRRHVSERCPPAPQAAVAHPRRRHARTGTARRCEGEILDTRAYRGIVDYEPTELVITARGGTPLAEIEAALAERDQMLRLRAAALRAATPPSAAASLRASPARAAPARRGARLRARRGRSWTARARCCISAAR